MYSCCRFRLTLCFLVYVCLATAHAQNESTSTLPENTAAPGTMRLVSVDPIPMAEDIVYSRDFVKASGELRITFPEEADIQTGHGATYRTFISGKGPRFDKANIETSRVDRVHITLSAEYQLGSDSYDYALSQVIFYWARNKEIRGKPWPFSVERRSVLKQGNPDDPHTWIGELQGKKNWEGVAKGGFFGIKLKLEDDAGNDEPPLFRVRVEKILFTRVGPQKD